MTYEYADHAPAPWDQQRRCFEATRDDEIHALFWEQRTGKSRPVIDTAAYNFEKGRIDGLLVFAPGGVHRNWLTEGIEQFLPQRIKRMTLAWNSPKMRDKKMQLLLNELLDFDGLAVLTINYDAIRTPTCKNYLGKFLRKRKLLIVADEADDISWPEAKRTTTTIRAGRWGKMRRVLTGTPVDEGPFSCYSITNFLQMHILGFSSYIAFQHFFAEYDRDENGDIVRQTRTIYDPATGKRRTQEYEEPMRDENGRPRYRNLEVLNKRMAPFTSRVTRVQCGGQLPHLVRRPFELAPQQREIYEELRQQFRAELEDEGAVTARMTLVRIMRLQQIASGFAVLDEAAEDCKACDGTNADCPACSGIGLVLPDRKIIELPNPRLDALEAELRGVQGQVVIWSRFTRDGDAIMKRLKEMGRRACRYDGTIDDDQREQNKLDFQAGKYDDLVGSPQAGGRGLDFSMARTAIYHSHHWSLRLRNQSQDRVETLKRKDPVVIVDLVAQDTVDERMTLTHASKRDVADAIQGEGWRNWL